VAAGIGVTLNWEYGSQDWLGGGTVGAQHATEAVRQAHALGYPTGCTIIGSADFDMTRTQWTSAGRGYALAFEAAIRAGGYQPGVYGPWDVLAWCDAETGIGVFWQAGMSTAWSGGRNANLWPGAHLRQRGHKTVGGLDADWNDILSPDWGQYKGDDMLADERAALFDIQTRVKWIDGREAAEADETDTYVDPAGKTHPANLVAAIKDIQANAAAAAQKTAPVALTDGDLQAIIAGIAANVNNKLDQVLARLTAAGQALDG
jgi:hypothetical protein